MGFFSDLKADLSQAVNELMPEDGRRSVDGKLPRDDRSPGTGDLILEDDIPDMSALKDLPAPKQEKIIFHKVPEGMESVRMQVPPLKEDPPEVREHGENRQLPSDITVVAENTTITGEVVSSNMVRIAKGARFIGNIHASGAVVAGAVKGDIDVNGPVTLEKTAIVVGNIKCKSVHIETGGVIEGMCSLSYCDVKPTAFFEEVKNENTEPEA